MRETEEAALAGVGRRLGHLLGVSLDDAASEPYMVRAIMAGHHELYVMIEHFDDVDSERGRVILVFCGQVVNHGLGGEYGAHRDTHGPTRTPPQPEIGERLATVLTHLQAPAQGRCRAGGSFAPRPQSIHGSSLDYYEEVPLHPHRRLK